ncbi:MAG: cyclic nucleotide-binding domain-containing protein [Desulfobulbaceae bacterium]|jgi:class 3 adenylate cyclase|nr:cyclic nucleotide-binding domain-containing protein [Desulfobulbaceae bacterium]
MLFPHQADASGYAEHRVVILMSDMEQYSRRTSTMTPEELRDFIIGYHRTFRDIVMTADSQPVEVEPSAGDGTLIIFRKKPGEGDDAICRRALRAAIRVAYTIADGALPPTRLGLFLGEIVEAELGGRLCKFSTSFAVANRLEELCGHFGTCLLMDREVARHQVEEASWLVSIGKFSLASVIHPMNAYSVYKPGLNNCPNDVGHRPLMQFIQMKNEAMDLFSGNLQMGILPDFPAVRDQLLSAQSYFVEMTGHEDKAISRILEYIRETPFPAADFNTHGMKLMEKKRDTIGERLPYLSKQLLMAMDYEIYHALVVDVQWEQYFKMDWYKAGSLIIQMGAEPDGVYFLDYGRAKTVDGQGALISTMDPGAIFGELAYFAGEKKRTATVIAETDVVVRKISAADFHNLPVIMEIFRRIAAARHRRETYPVGGPIERRRQSWPPAPRQ